MKRLVGTFLAASLAVGAWAVGQERTGAVRVSVVPDRADWSYAIGAPARFRVDVVRDGHPLAGTAVKVACGPEMMPPTQERTLTLGADGLRVDAGTMKEPGFLRCAATTSVDGREYRAVGTAAYAPEKIEPAVVIVSAPPWLPPVTTRFFPSHFGWLARKSFARRQPR